MRTPDDIARVSKTLQSEPAKIATEEIPRMNTVMKNFVIYRWIEIALVAAGLLLLVFGHEDSLWRGVGIGLTFQAGLMLALDYFAESRGAQYLSFLKGLA